VQKAISDSTVSCGPNKREKNWKRRMLDEHCIPLKREKRAQWISRRRTYSAKIPTTTMGPTPPPLPLPPPPPLPLPHPRRLPPLPLNPARAPLTPPPLAAVAAAEPRTRRRMETL